jgi:hypothetical protein
MRNPAAKRSIRLTAATACALAALAGMSATALGATTRYAAPGGNGTACTEALPCSIFEATNGTSVADGDEAVIEPGTYNPTTDPALAGSTVGIFEAVNVHGRAGSPAPQIVSGAGTAVGVHNPLASLSDVRIDNTAGFTGLIVGSGTAQRVFVRIATGGGTACQHQNGVLRDSVCWSDGAVNGTAAGMNGGGSINATLRNVTAIATGTPSTGINYRPSNGAFTATVDAKGVIADGVTVDVVGGANFGQPVGTTVITLANSNYATELETGDAGASSVTDPGTGTNQGAGEPPVFADALLGDFHQLPASPTVDHGAVDSFSGSLDLDGHARTLGTAADIGADEFVPPAVPLDPPATPAQATGLRAAALKKCKKKKTKAARKKCIRKARKLPL